jgi:hypothetical protein
MANNDVQFEEEDTMLTQHAYASMNEPKGLVKLVMKLGLAKNEAGANYVLIGIMVLALIATMYVISTYII